MYSLRMHVTVHLNLSCHGPALEQRLAAFGLRRLLHLQLRAVYRLKLSKASSPEERYDAYPMSWSKMWRRKHRVVEKLAAALGRKTRLEARVYQPALRVKFLRTFELSFYVFAKASSMLSAIQL